MIPQVHPALLLLAQSVVVFACRRIEGGHHPVALRPRISRRHVGALRHHRPGAHVQQRLAVGRGHQQSIIVRGLPAPAPEIRIAQLKIQRIERHRLRQFLLRKVPRRHAHHQPIRSEYVVPFRVALVRPSLGRRLGHKPVPRSACGRGLIGAHRHPQYVWGIGLQRNHPAFALQNHRTTLGHRHCCQRHRP